MVNHLAKADLAAHAGKNILRHLGSKRGPYLGPLRQWHGHRIDAIDRNPAKQERDDAGIHRPAGGVAERGDTGTILHLLDGARQDLATNTIDTPAPDSRFHALAGVIRHFGTINDAGRAKAGQVIGNLGPSGHRRHGITTPCQQHRRNRPDTATGPCHQNLATLRRHAVRLKPHDGLHGGETGGANHL